MFRKLQNLQNLNNIGKLNSIFKESTQNLKRQGFTKLLQTNRSKCRSNFVDHVSKVRFEVWDLDLCGSRVLGENPKENRVRGSNFGENELISLLYREVFEHGMWPSGHALQN